jgi:hypothetical protein
MDLSTLLLTMGVSGIVMAVLPFLFFMIVGSLVGLDTTSNTMLFGYFILLVIVSYGLSIGAFTLLQSTNCNEVKNFKRIALNSLITVGFQVVLFALTFLIPFLKHSIRGLFSPDFSEVAKDSTVYSYYAFWGMVMSVALGGTMSGSCQS